MSAPTIESVAFDTASEPYRGHSVRASYLKEPDNQDALIEIRRGDEVVKSFRYPAYRVYNIAAHFSELVDSLLREA